MADMGKTYIPNPELVKVLAGTGETLFQFVCRHTELVKARESELGAYAGDGPTSEQVDSLLATLRPIFETTGPHAPSVVWHAFQAAVQVEMSWLFPESDPIGFPMTAALREVQNMTGTVLEQAQPEMVPGLHEYANLAVVENALSRQEKLHGNSLIWRLSFMCRMAWRVFCGGSAAARGVEIGVGQSFWGETLRRVNVWPEEKAAAATTLNRLRRGDAR